ncbi:MAG TPA: PQQ-binding-like beta-propeller repeat protein [Gemmataceae bacterium]|nr:PQQ-binding-like beta-propeller repeat protein [Gemmataceae bacterium]
MARCLISLFSFVLICQSFAAEPNWPQFRGTSAGVSEDQGLPSKWDTKTNVIWAKEIPGRGWSSPVIWGNRIFLTSVINEGKTEEPKKGLYFGGERMKPTDAVHRWMVYCLDRQTGKIVWEREAAKEKPTFSVHIKNTYASATPVTDGESIYTYFGNLGVYCYDFAGTLKWSKKLEVEPTRFSWGPAASPALFQDRLFIVNDNEKDSYFLCLNAKTGDELWKVKRDEKSNWSTPFVWENEKRTELVTAGSGKVRSYDLEGKLLWELQGMSSIAIPTPFAKHGLLYVASGYILDKNSKPIYAIRPGASGDVSLKDGETSNEFIAWSNRQIGPYNPTPVVYGDYLYVLYDMGMLSCFEAKTGKLVYEKERLSGQFTVSPWAYDGKIFCLNEDGDTFVVQAGPEFKMLGKNKLDEMCMACPAIVGKSLFIRTLSKLYRIEGAGR